MKPADIKRIADAAKGHGAAILATWLPGGKQSGKEYQALNPHRDDKHLGNLSVDVATGKGGDFATGETFGDFVGMVAFAMQCDQSTAADALAEFLRIPPTGAVPPAPTFTPTKSEPEWRPILPIPADAPPPPKACNHKHKDDGKPLGRYDVLYAYRAAGGMLLGYVARWNETTTRSKDFRPLTYGSTGKKAPCWDFKGWQVPRPLYGQDQIAINSDATVFVHEGEKAAVAAGELLLPFVSTCYPNGWTGADKADYSPLAGRDVVIWPDHDESGTKGALTAAKAAKKAKAKRVQFVNLDLLAKHTVNAQGQIIDRLTPLPAGWDAADALAEGWTPAAITELLGRAGALLDNLVPDVNEDVAGSAEEPMKTTAPKTAQRFGSYIYDAERGLFFIERKKDDEDIVQEVEKPVCGPLLVPALARDDEGGGWAAVVEFTDRDGQQRREIIPCKEFIGLSFDGVKQLVDLGLEIASNKDALNRLRNFINGAKPLRRARLFDQTGWHGRAFLLPDSAIGETDETLLFRGNRRVQGVYGTKGKLTDWQSHIANPAVGNPRLMFALSTAFAGPLLKPLNLPGTGFHIGGDSSTGKSGAQHAAGSVWGSTEAQVHSWRTTDNAVEYTAAQHNDALLILDELREVDPKAAGAIVYMLTNARGKGRAHHAGGLREVTNWRIVMLSSGELGLSDHLASAGQRHFAGQEVRFIEIEADAGAGHGMWNDVSVCAGGGKQFTDQLKKFAGRYYGTAGRAFLVALVKHLDQLPTLWRDYVTAFERRYKPPEAGGQVLRVMSAFCLVGFAGELASKFEIVPWPRGAATTAAGDLFAEWATARPSKGNGEESKIIAHVRGVMERAWQSRFVDWERTQEKDGDLSRMTQIIDPLGFRKRDALFTAEQPEFLFYVTRGRFTEEFGAKGGFKHKRVAAVLKKHGVLQCDADGTTYRETLPNGDPRSYCIIGKKLWALDL
jgi:uncharacterized protein (DUF927 family)